MTDRILELARRFLSNEGLNEGIALANAVIAEREAKAKEDASADLLAEIMKCARSIDNTYITSPAMPSMAVRLATLIMAWHDVKAIGHRVTGTEGVGPDETLRDGVEAGTFIPRSDKSDLEKVIAAAENVRSNLYDPNISYDANMQRAFSQFVAALRAQMKGDQ